jgi:hypothetical protein
MSDQQQAEALEKSVEKVEKVINDPAELLAEISKGLDELIPDEILRAKVAGWARKRLAEMAMVVMQQSGAIESLSRVLDDVLAKLRQWSDSSEKGWFKARMILREVLTSWKARTGGSHAGDGKEGSVGAGAEGEGQPDATPPSTEADRGGEKPVEGVSEG